MRWNHYFLHFRHKETETQAGSMTGSKSPSNRGVEVGLNPGKAVWLPSLRLKPLHYNVSLSHCCSLLFHHHHPAITNLIQHTELSKSDILGNWPNKERCLRKKASRHHYKHVILHTHRHTCLLFGVWHVRVMVIKHIISHHFLPHSAGPFCHLQHPFV